MGFRTDMRAAALALLNGYRSSSSDKVQVYPGRPMSIYPPTAFIEAINEPTIAYFNGPRTRTPVVEIILIQGIFDNEEAANLQDAFVDDFIDYVTTNKHQAGGGTIVTIDSVEDLPNYQPDWIPNAPFYYASRLTLGGLKREQGLI